VLWSFVCVGLGVAPCYLTKLALHRKPIPSPNILDLIVSKISAFIRTARQTDMTRSTRLVILIKNVYTLWRQKLFLLPVTYFPTNLEYPFTPLVTGIMTDEKFQDVNFLNLYLLKVIWQDLL